MTEPNVPSRVTENIELIQSLRHAMFDDAIKSFYQAIKSLNIDPQTLINQLEEYVSKQRGEHSD